MRATALFFVLTVLLSQDAGFAANPNEKAVKAYPLNGARYEDIKKALDKVKSKDGSISYIKFSKKVLVVDTPAVHKLVQKILLETAKPSVNIRVEVDFMNQQMIRKRGLKLGYAYRDGTQGRLKFKARPSSIEGPNGVTTKAEDQKGSTSTNTQMTINVSSGEAAQLWSTKTAIDRQHLRWYNLVPFQVVRQPGGGQVVVNGEFPEPITRDVGSSMWVKPTYLPNGLVRIELFPVLSYETKDGNEQLFRVDKVSTTITVSPKRRMFIGGNNKGMRKFLKDLFATEVSHKEFNDSLSIYVTAYVRILDPTKGRPRPERRPASQNMWRHFPD